MPVPNEVGCPLCGNDVPADEAKVIEVDMEFENRTCITCGKNYWEVREELDL